MVLLVTELFRIKPELSKKTKKIHFSTFESICLYMRRLQESVCCGLCSFSEDAKAVFISRGESLAEKELDLVRIVKFMRRLQKLLELDDFADKHHVDNH